TDPGEPDRVVAVAARGDADAAAAAVRAAREAFPAWRGMPAGDRADTLLRAAARLRERRLELAALQVRECAKPWGEADADVCEALVRDPGVHTIAFTGSSAVGLGIVRAAAETPDGQGHVKRVVAEMGGKNCVIVDSDADLDEAVPAIVRSAFVYAGQKCSA